MSETWPSISGSRMMEAHGETKKSGSRCARAIGRKKEGTQGAGDAYAGRAQKESPGGSGGQVGEEEQMSDIGNLEKLMMDTKESLEWELHSFLR